MDQVREGNALVTRGRGGIKHCLPAIMVIALLQAPACLAQSAAGQQYPVKPIRLVLGQSPGGGTDLVARMLAQKLAERLGQSVVVENRTGASGAIAAAFVAKSPPDGYTALIVSSGYTINPSLYDLPFDPVKDFAPVSFIADAPSLLVVHPSMPVRTVKELVSLAKAKPGMLNFASGGKGSSSHMAAELLQFLAGIRMVHVPYKGAGPALVDLIAGEVHLAFGSVMSASPHVKSGKLRPLAITSAKRSSAVPELPTLSEAGVRGYQTTTWYGALLPARAPSAIVDRLSAEIGKVIQAPDVKNRFLTDGAEPVGGTPEQFDAFIKAEIARWKELVKRAGIRF